jgi:hypothetical protein
MPQHCQANRFKSVTIEGCFIAAPGKKQILKSATPAARGLCVDCSWAVDTVPSKSNQLTLLQQVLTLNTIT